MSTEENKAVVRRELEELYNEGGNLDAAEEIYVPDFVGHEPAVGDIRGVEGAKHTPQLCALPSLTSPAS